MNQKEMIKAAEYFVEHSQDNTITKEIAISENVIGLKIFHAPILAFGSANDAYFQLLKHPSAIGKHFLLPEEWLPQCKTVISFFLPFSEAVKEGNRHDMSWPSEEWLHGRIEGQILVNKLSSHIQSLLIASGYPSLVPALDERFWLTGEKPQSDAQFTSNWSERHVAYACGLGTFGLSKGLITQKGIAGRFGSILTELEVPPDKREYVGIYEYCSMCGKCAKNCPVNAISIQTGKDHLKCSRFMDQTGEKYHPRYGCGKCQINVPCESGVPLYK